MRKLLAVLAMGLMVRVGLGAAVHVSVEGDDGNVGDAGHPLKTLEAARGAARKTAGKEETQVILHGGTFYLEHALELGSADSGTEKFPVVWKGAQGEKV